MRDNLKEKLLKYQKTYFLLFFRLEYLADHWSKFWLIGKPVTSLTKLKREKKGNHLANQQTNGVLNTIPSLRFLPLPMSLISHETKSVLRQLLYILEMLSILCISL